MSSLKWNAKDYKAHSSAQQKWARELISKLELKGNEKVLDIGCGDGKNTAEIASKLPNGSIVEVDISKEMIELAIESFPHKTYKNMKFKLCDASKLNFEEEFDIIFSNATLHWIIDHLPVLQGIKKALREKGKVLLQMAGKGNAKDIINCVKIIIDLPKWRDFFIDFEFSYRFYGKDKYESLLNKVGLHKNYIKLIDKDMTHKGRDKLTGWFRTTWFPLTNRVPEDLRNIFIEEVMDNYLDKYPIDNNGFTHVKMVRLEVLAENL